MNLTDPIVPGESAAGVQLGDPIELHAQQSSSFAKELLHTSSRYTFGAIRLWVDDGVITQIGVSAPYEGKIHGEIGIGSTIADVERVFGRVEEDDADNLVVVGSTGWCFETEEWILGRTPGENVTACISEIFVFAHAAH